MIKRQIKGISFQKGNCIQIRYALLFQITCLQTLAIKKTYLRFCVSYQESRTFKFTVTSSSSNFFKCLLNTIFMFFYLFLITSYFQIKENFNFHSILILFCEVDQVLQETFVKQNVPNSSFHLGPDTNCMIKFDILSR